jgi:hypothetical protein
MMNSNTIAKATPELIAARANGGTYAQLAVQFNTGVSTIQRLLGYKPPAERMLPLAA